MVNFVPYNSLTDREKYLDQLIRSALQSLTTDEIVGIPVTQENVNWLISQISIMPNEYDFVVNRMACYWKTKQDLQETDQFIDFMSQKGFHT